jgi:hypothetical protein
LEIGEAAESAEAGFAFEAGSLAGEAQFEDGIEGGVEVQDEGAFGLAGQEDQVEFLHGFLGRLGHVGAPEELEDDVADAGAADAAEAVETADHAEGFFDGSADFVLDFFGGGPGYSVRTVSVG